MNQFLEIENRIIISLGWPVWACRSLVSLAALIILTIAVQLKLDTNANKDSSLSDARPTTPFRWFQLQYLSVFLIIMLADWLQGTNMYTLYSSYGLNVGTLFLTGFLSSAIFGTVLGIYVDTWGRRLGCIVFCILEIVINLMEHIPHMPTLILGRILGGLSTSLLFTAFESWMVSEHRKRGFSEALLASTFAICSWGNGLVAIIAGVFAQIASDIGGDIGPFQLAIALTVVTLLLIFTWTENFGSKKAVKTASAPEQSLMRSMISSVRTISKSTSILCLGLSQSFFEGAVFTFVFVWVPSLLAVLPKGSSLPTGLVFSSFMMAMTVGGLLFGMILPYFPGGAEGLSVLVYVTAAVAMLVPAFWFEFWPVYVSFLVLEAMAGMFFSCAGTLRSKYYPEEQQSSLMSCFRLPLNLLVVVGTRLADNTGDAAALRPVFSALSAMFAVSLLLHCGLLAVSLKHDKKTKQKAIMLASIQATKKHK